MNQTKILNNSVYSILDYIESCMYYHGIKINTYWDDDEYLKLERLVNDIENDHSKYSKFIRESIHKWFKWVHQYSQQQYKLDEQVLNNFITVHAEEINKKVFENIEYIKRQIEDHKRKKEKERRNALQKANEEIERLLKLKTKKNDKTFFANAELNRLDLHPEDMQRLWKTYKSKWVPFNKRNQSMRPKPFTTRIPDTFEDKLKNYIKTHSDEKHPISLENFEKMTQGWPSTLKSIKDWHQYYLDNHPSNFTDNDTYKDTDNENGNSEMDYIGFKTPQKINALKKMFPNKKAPDTSIPGSFPLKSNKKQYQLHKVAPRNTYIIDLMFNDKYTYLVAINVNTRYLFVECMNERLFSSNTNEDYKRDVYSRANKNAKTFIDNLDCLIKSGMNVRYLQGDGERAFNSAEAWIYYDQHGIQFTPVPRMNMGVYPDFMSREQKQAKTDPMHGSLGILDRVIRTLRDMAYNMQVGIIKPGIMKELVNQYNNAPHKTLSKYAGMEVTPKMVQDDKELEEFIVRRICQQNYEIMHRPGFKLDEGTSVKVYNEKDSMMKRRSIIQPGRFTVKGFKNGLYQVADANNKIQLIPRYKIDFE